MTKVEILDPCTGPKRKSGDYKWQHSLKPMKQNITYLVKFDIQAEIRPIRQLVFFRHISAWRPIMASNDTSILDNLEIDVQHDISFYFFIFRNRIQTFQAVFSMKGTAYLIHYVTGVQIKLDLFVKKFFLYRSTSDYFRQWQARNKNYLIGQ